MNLNDMSTGDFVKILKACLVSMLIPAPLFVFIFLSSYGVFGENFNETYIYKIIFVVLVIFTIIMLIVWQPFFYWARLFNGSGTRDDLLKTGKSGTGVIKSIGEMNDDVITVNRKPHFYLPLGVEIQDRFSPYIVNFTSLVPASELTRIKTGIEIPLKIDRNNNENIAIDWERF